MPDFGFSFQDKVIHTCAFFVYGMFLQLFLARTLRLRFGAKYILLFFLIGCLFGASDEIHQYFVPGRSSEVMDWMADTSGLLLSLVVVFLISRFRVFDKK
ncbi:MAG: VanZ family protein [Ignavibacteriae bacterium]|nr:VanZ family protein [Ignavibacteriota bacterium]